MDALLSPVSTTYTRAAANEEPFLRQVKAVSTSALPSASPSSPSTTTTTTTTTRRTFTATSADEALDILRNEPDYDTLVAVLRFLLSSAKSSAPAAPAVNVRTPSPVSAQLVQVLVTAILPNYWAVLQEEEQKEDRALLLACLRSVTGLSALTVRLRALLAEAKTKTATSTSKTQQDQLHILLSVLSKLLAGDEAVAQVWSASTTAADDTARQQRPLQHEFLSIIGSGKIMSLAAEAEPFARESLSTDTTAASAPPPPFWIASGREYSRWLTRNIIHWALKNRRPEAQKVQGALLGKALRLGYIDAVISTLVTDLILCDAPAKDDALAGLLEQLPAYEQKKILDGILKFAADTYFGPASLPLAPVDAGIVSAVAGLIKTVVGSGATNNGPRQEQLVSWLLTSPGVGLPHGAAIRRAAVAVVAATRPGALAGILEKAMAEFGDQLFIKHAPMLQQEAKAQVLLLVAAYVGRPPQQRDLTALLRSRTYLSLVSNRLGASHNRAKFLGMVVGEALSGLVDDNKQKLDFHMDEMRSDEVQWYKSLATVHDVVGKLDLLKTETKKQAPAAATASTRPSKPSPPKAPSKAARRPPVQPAKPGFIIEELDDDDDDDDDEKKYGKPDSDAEDSDDDPALLRRDKPKAPVYIRDLITYLRDTENYDKQKLALATAPPLIRRKATFGTEVAQHAHDLASLLIGLQDAFSMDDFHALRLQGMVALVVAQPQLIGPYYARVFFEGDYSVAQRASVLSALGLGARELAGFDVSEYAATAATAFPTKKLPGRVEHLYVLPSEEGSQGGGHASAAARSLKPLARGALDSITNSLTASFLRPMAAKAADEVTGPDVLKMTSFKSRLKDMSSSTGSGAADKNAITRNNKRQPAKGTANTTGQLLASSVFFPLLSRFQLALQASSSVRLRNLLFDPMLLSLYLKTLAVVLHAAGPSTLALPDMTAELWTLLLSSSVQAHCVGDLLVTHAVLFAVMAVLDVNEHRVRELCRDLPREVVQTRDWALQVVENMRGAGADAAGPGSQESEVQMLAAGTYIRLSEGMESYRSLLLGEIIG